jgi:hypothetical protein
MYHQQRARQLMALPVLHEAQPVHQPVLAPAKRDSSAVLSIPRSVPAVTSISMCS